MKLTKRIISFICVVAMVFSMCVFSVSAADPLTIDETVGSNWNPIAAKYSKTTYTVLAPRGDNYEIRTTGFDFQADAEGGIKVHTATYKENSGVYSVAAVASKNKTALDGLSIEFKPDDLTMEVDSNNASSNISFLITENPVTRLAGFNDTSKEHDTGLYSSVDVASNGLRELAFDPGKSLVVTVSNQKMSNTEDHVATTVAIVYDDGSYKNTDGHTGFRWVFTARNYIIDSPVGDLSGIVQAYQHIDFSEGLKLEVRADDKLGYIVTVNGVDYYSSDYIAFYPDCTVDTFYGKEYKTYALYDEDYSTLSDNYLKSMTYAQKDIDLTGLGENFEGYLTVGATGTNITTNSCDFTITKINTHPAATWTGEVACQHTETEVVVTKEANCGYDGEEVTKCVDCGKVISKTTLNATGEHAPADEYVVTKAATCVAEGVKAQYCTVCDQVVDTQVIAIDADAHKKVTKDILAPTCDADGTQQDVCSLCDKELGDVVTVPALGHDDGEWVVTVEPTCTEKGSKNLVCTRCDEFVIETAEVEATGHDENSEWVEKISATYFDEGLMEQLCSRCNEVIGTEVIPVKSYVNIFPDVKPSQWYGAAVEYVVKRGYMSGNANGTFAPNGTLTREQFVIILANMAGADTDAYKGANGGFTDIKANQWYTGAVVWAVNEGYVTGLGNGKFGRGEPIQRAALARLLYLYAEKNNIETAEPTTDFSAFADAKKIDNWMKDGIGWAVANGIVSGNKKADGKLYIEPKGTATRAQAAVMLRAFDAIRGLVTID